MANERKTKLAIKQYKKLMRKHEKEFKKLCKEFRIWDWCYIHNLIVKMVEWAYDFYCKNPDPICAKDWIDDRREEFEKVLGNNESWSECDEISSKMFHLSSKYIRGETEVGGVVCPSVSIEVKDEDMKEQSRKFSEMSNNNFKEFYKKPWIIS